MASATRASVSLERHSIAKFYTWIPSMSVRCRTDLRGRPDPAVDARPTQTSYPSSLAGSGVACIRMRALLGCSAARPTSLDRHLTPARNVSPSPVSSRDETMAISAACSNRPCGLPTLSAIVSDCGLSRALDCAARAIRALRRDIQDTTRDDNIDGPAEFSNPSTFVRLRTDSRDLQGASLP